MVDVNKLKGLIVERGLTQTEVYSRIGLSKRQWQHRMENKKFDSNEIGSLIKLLDIDNPSPIFFAD